MEEEKKKYYVYFNGYRLEEKAEGLPDYSGIYMAYRCTYNKDIDKVSLKEIVYIGQTWNLAESILGHKDKKDLHNVCESGETICYAYAFVSLRDIDIVENALVYAQKPRLNTNSGLKNSFNYRPTTFEVEGTCAKLQYTSFKIS